MKNGMYAGHPTQSEKVLSFLGSLPSKYIEIEGYRSLESSMGLTAYQIGQRMIEFEHKNFIRLHHKTTPGGRKIVKGIEILKLPGSATAFEATATKAKSQIKTITVNKPDTAKLPLLHKYLAEKLRIEELKENMLAVGIDPTIVDQFLTENVPSNEYAEEAIYLLSMVDGLSMQLASSVRQRDELEIDCKMYRDQADFWKAKVPEATRETLMAIAPKKKDHAASA